MWKQLSDVFLQCYERGKGSMTTTWVIVHEEVRVWDVLCGRDDFSCAMAGN